MTAIRLTVDGWPPAKSEALSMFAKNHRHHHRVRALLEAADEALAGSQWGPDERRPIGLDLVVVESATSPPPSDATNLLGGVADVLQANRVNADLSHLGKLADVSLYADDRQIREARYSVERGAKPGYRVCVRVLDAAA